MAQPLASDRPATAPAGRGSVVSEKPDPAKILAEIGHAAFVWDIASDTMVWTHQAASVFADIPSDRLATGAAFSAFKRSAIN